MKAAQNAVAPTAVRPDRTEPEMTRLSSPLSSPWVNSVKSAPRVVRTKRGLATAGPAKLIRRSV